jgi:hypothetical protein
MSLWDSTSGIEILNFYETKKTVTVRKVDILGATSTYHRNPLGTDYP